MYWLFWEALFSWIALDKPVDHLLPSLGTGMFGLEVGGGGDGFQIRPAEQGSGHHRELLIAVGLDGQSLEQRAEDSLGVHVHSSGCLVASGLHGHTRPAQDAQSPGEQRGMPPVLPSAAQLRNDHAEVTLHRLVHASPSRNGQ